MYVIVNYVSAKSYNMIISTDAIYSFCTIKGAKVTRSTSAYALPLFLPRPKNSRQKPLV